MNDANVRSHRLLSIGRNCWKVARARRIALLVDGEAYFSALAAAFERAEERITILGWDFHSRICLRPGDDGTQLAKLLRRLVEEKPRLEIYIQVWRNSFLYAHNTELPELFEPEWSAHPRIRFRTDDLHPTGASRHAKIVCIDGKLAFIGGMDLTERRWDDPEHSPENPDRLDTTGAPYPPMHDVQALVDGDAAVVTCELANARWHELTGEMLAPPRAGGDPWPPGLRAAVRDQDVAISRTIPAYKEREEIREIEALNEDSYAAAREFIYVENQYFVLPRVAEIMADHLSRPDGPEIVIVANNNLQGALESYVMGENRDRLFSFLHNADRYGRLRTYHPVVGSDPACRIRVHSKVTAVDDRLFRVGSANINARSTGFDDECDLVVEPWDDRGRKAIVQMRNALLAEHLSVTPGRFAEAVRQRGSVIAAIDHLNTGDRRLAAYDVPEWKEGPLRAPGSHLLDPPGPLDLGSVLQSIMPGEDG